MDLFLEVDEASKKEKEDDKSLQLDLQFNSQDKKLWKIWQKNIIKYRNTEQGLNVHFINQFVSKEEARKFFKILEKNVHYNSVEDSKIFIGGELREIPRRQTMYAADVWSGHSAVDQILEILLHRLLLYTGRKYNSVALNRYENGDQHIGFHSDKEHNLVKDVTIAGISFGSRRPMSFKNKISGRKELEVYLDDGSLIYIDYPTNNHWLHAIPKVKKKIGPRISLTFRQLAGG